MVRSTYHGFKRLLQAELGSALVLRDDGIELTCDALRCRRSLDQTMEVASKVLGVGVLFGAIQVTLSTWLVRRLRRRWQDMTFWTRLTASVVAAPVALGALSTVFGLAMAFGAIIGDPSKKELLLAVGLDNAMMGTGLTLFFSLANLAGFSDVTKDPETRRRRQRGQQTRGSSPLGR